MGNFFGLEISKRAIMTHQTALLTVGHNIANANTAGYSKQVARMVTPIPWETPSLTNSSHVGQLGTGVEVASIDRYRDEFLDNQMRNETRIEGYWTSMQESLDMIEMVVNEPSDDGLRSLMDKFWASWQDLSTNAENESYRTVVVQQGKALADAFNHTYIQLNDLRRDLNQTISTKLTDINSKAKQIADLNQQILAISVSGRQPNDLLDKRDLLIDDLSKLTDIKVAYIDQRAEGAYNSFGKSSSGGLTSMVSVQVGGHALVMGTDYAQLSYKTDAQGMYMPVWAGTEEKAVFDGGEMGALLDARGKTDLESDPSPYEEVVTGMIESLNSLAKTIVVKTNELHRSGYSLNNKTYSEAPYPDGTNFFAEPEDWDDLKGQWAQHMAVDQDIASDAKNIAAARYRTWDGTEGDMLPVNYGDGKIALKIAQLKQSLNSHEYALSRVRVDAHSTDPLEFSFNKDGQLATISVEAPYSYDEDLGKVAEAIQTKLDANNIAVKVRCDGSDIIFYSTSIPQIEYIDPDSGIQDIKSENLQDASYTLSTDTGQPGAHNAQLRVVQSYLQGSAANILGSGIAGTVLAGTNINSSIELTVDSVNTASGVVRYSYVAHEYDRDTGLHTNVTGLFEVTYGGAAVQNVNIGNMSFQLTNLNTKTAADAAELKAGDTGVLNEVAQTLAGTNYHQLQVTYNNDGEDDYTQKFVFADNLLDGTGTDYRRLEFFTVDDQASSSTYGTSYDGHLDLAVKSLGTADPAAFFTYYQPDRDKDNKIINSASGINNARADGLAVGEYEISTRISQPGAAAATLRLMRDNIQGTAPDIFNGGSIGNVTAGTDRNASLEITIAGIAGNVVTYSYVSHEYLRSNGQQSEHTGTFTLNCNGVAQNINIGSFNVNMNPAASAAGLTVGDTAVLNLTAATNAATTYQQMQIAYNSATEAEMIQDFVFDDKVLDNLTQARMNFFTMHGGKDYDGYIELQTKTLATSDPALYLNYTDPSALEISQKRSIDPASGITDITAVNLQSGDYQVITSDGVPGAAAVSIQQSWNHRGGASILGSGSLTTVTQTHNASIQLEVTNVDPVTGNIDYSYVADIYDKTGAYTRATGAFTLTYGGASPQAINIGAVPITLNVSGLNLRAAADASEMQAGDKGIINLSAAQVANDDVVTVMYNEGLPSQTAHSYVFNNNALNGTTFNMNFQTMKEPEGNVYDSTISLEMVAFGPSDPAARIKYVEDNQESLNTASGILDYSASYMEEQEYAINTNAFIAPGSAAAITLQSDFLRGSSGNIFGSGTTLGALVGADDINASIEIKVKSTNRNTGEVVYTYKTRQYQCSTGNFSEEAGTFSLAYGGPSPQNVVIGAITIPVIGLDTKLPRDNIELVPDDEAVFSVTPALTAGNAYDQLDVVYAPGTTDQVTKTFYFADGVLNNQTNKNINFYTLNDENGGMYSPTVTISTGANIVTTTPAARFVYRATAAYGPNVPSPDLDVDLIENMTTDEFWRSLTSDIGVRNQEAERMVSNQETLVAELENKRQSISGVSIDEEMTEMIKLQHGYNASARMLTAVDEMIDVIVNRMGLAGR